MTPRQAAQKFAFPGRLIRVRPITSGNINDTFLAVFRARSSEERGIVQRINRKVFKRPGWIIQNMRAVTEHVHKRLEREAAKEERIWQMPRLVPAKGGKDYFIDKEGDWWRAMTAIASAVSYDRVQGAGHALEAGAVLGQFHRLLSDMDASSLKDTLPGFHVTPLYLKAYDGTLRRPRAKISLSSSSAAREIARFIEERRASAGVLESARERKKLRVRPIHGDPKISNIMMDERTGKGAGIVDLDTVKPGLIHYDFGDALRSIANPAGEEAEDLGAVRFDENLCAAFFQGYMSRAAEFLTSADRKYFYDSIRLIAFELGLRFFQDYLAGDVYFKVRAPEQNLHRARVQFRLCESIEVQESSIRRILEAKKESINS